VDEYNQLAQTKSAELELLRARFTLRNDKATLAQTLQMDPLTNLVLTDPSWDLLEVKSSSLEINSLIETALANRGDYQELLKLELASKYNLSATKTAVIPSLSAFGSIGSFYTDASVPSFNDQFDSNQRIQYGLQLNIPIFNGLQNKLSVVRSRVVHDNARISRENIEIQVKSDVIRAYNNYQDVLQAHGVAEAQFEAAQLAFDFEKERYKLGIINLVDYTVANRTFVEAETSFAQATFNLLFQKIALDFAVGTLKLEDGL
jgi:outer membrane protein